MGRFERFDPVALAGARRAGRGIVRRFPGRKLRRRQRNFGIMMAIAAGLTFGMVFAAPDMAQLLALQPAGTTASSAVWTGRFVICSGPVRVDCVVDGDTFWMGGEKVRLADIDTPELHPSHCVEEARRGEAAKRRLHALLNTGEVELHRADAPDRDRYGRLLRNASVDGRDVGAIMIGEGLARPYAGGRRPWCQPA